MDGIEFVQVLDPQPPVETAKVIDGGDGWIYAMPADETQGALDWWETRLTPYRDDSGVWCLGQPC